MEVLNKANNVHVSLYGICNERDVPAFTWQSSKSKTKLSYGYPAFVIFISYYVKNKSKDNFFIYIFHPIKKCNSSNEM